MAAILQLRRGTSNVTLTEGELYLHQGSGSVQFGSGSSQHTLVKIGSNTGNVSLIGDLSVTGNLTVSQNITFGGSIITLGNENTDNIVISGELSSSLVPNDDAAFDLGSSSKRYKTLYVVSASIDNISLPGSNIVSSSQQISNYDVFLEKNGDNVFSGSSQVNANSIQNFDDNVLDKMNVEGVFSGSSQVTYSGISLIPSGIVSGSSQITPLLPTGVVSGSSQVSYPDLSNIPSGIISGSSQVSLLLPNGVVSGSSQVVSLLPTGVVSGSSQVVSLLPSGVVSGSSQVLGGTGIVSGSSQIDTLGFLKVGGDGVFSGSSQVDITSTAGILDISSRTNLAVSDTENVDMILTGDTLSANLKGGVVSGSSQITLSGDITGTANNTAIGNGVIVNADVNAAAAITYTKLDLGGSNIVSGSGQIDGLGFLKVGGDGVISGSSQVSADQTEGWAEDVKTQLNSNTVISGSSQVNADSIINFDSNVKDKMNADSVISGSSQVTLGNIPGFNAYTNSVDVRVDSIESYTSSLKDAIDVDGTDLIVLGNLTVQGTQTSLNTTELLIEDLVLTLASGSADGNEANGAGIEIAGANQSLTWDNPNAQWAFTGQVSASGFIGDGSNLENVTAADVEYSNVLNKPTLISGSDQVTQSLDNRYLEINGDSVISGSSQIDLTQTTNYTSGIKTRLNVDNVHSGSYLGTATTSNLTEGTRLYYTDARVKTKLDAEGVFSSSAQVNADTISNFDTNVLAYNNSLGVISGSSQVSADQTDGWAEDFKVQLDANTVISGSSQVNADSILNFDANVKDKMNADSVISGSAQIKNLLPSGTVSGSQQVVSSLPNGTVSGSQQVIDLLPSGVVSGSSQVNADSITNFDSNVKDKMNSDSVVSGSSSEVKTFLSLQNVTNESKTTMFSNPTFTGTVSGVTAAHVGLGTTDSPEFSGLSLTALDEIPDGSPELNAVFLSSSNELTYRSLGTAALYHVTSSDGVALVSGSISYESDNLLTAGAVKKYVDWRTEDILDAINAADITAVNSGDGLSGGATSGDVTLTLDTSSAHFNNGVIANFTSLNLFTESVDSDLSDLFQSASLAASANASGNDRLNSLEGFTSSIDTTIKTKLDSEEVISGSSQVSADQTDGWAEDFKVQLDANTVISGSSQVSADQTDGWADDFKVQLDANTVISGSGQLTDMTGDVTVNSSGVSAISSGVIVNDDVNAFAAINYTKINFAGSGILSSSQEIWDFDLYSSSIDSRINYTEELAHSHSNKSYLDTINQNLSTTSNAQFNQLSTEGDIFTSGSIIPKNAGATLGSAEYPWNEAYFAGFTIYVGSASLSEANIVTTQSLQSQLPVGIVSSSTQIEQIIGESPITVISSSAQISNYGIFAELGGDNLISSSDQLTGSLLDLTSEQTIDGTKIFNNIVVNGTGSFANFVATQTSIQYIGDSFIVLNNDTPTQRFAGLSVYDSGSAGVTASLQFDGQLNDWFYEYSNDGGVTTDHGVVLFGPEYSTKGSPTYNTQNRILKSNGNHHLLDSNISDTGTLITLNSNSQVNGNLVVNGSVSANNLISGSSQVLGNTGIISGSSQISLGGDLSGTADSANVIKIQGVSITSGEATQLANINTTTISTTQWGYLGALNQGLTTTSTVQFGKVGVGGASDITYELKVAGDIGATGDIVAYLSSDKRLKDNILPIENPLQKINSIGGYSFDWNVEKQHIYKGKDYGVIAQEIEEILPELVDTRENGYKAVKYDKLVSLLIEGIKELSKEVEELKKQIK